MDEIIPSHITGTSATGSTSPQNPVWQSTNQPSPIFLRCIIIVSCLEMNKCIAVCLVLIDPTGPFFLTYAVGTLLGGGGGDRNRGAHVPVRQATGAGRARVEELLTGADKVLQHDDLLISFLSELPTSQALKVDTEGEVVVLF